jgi:hypothetical protein
MPYKDPAEEGRRSRRYRQARREATGLEAPFAKLPKELKIHGPQHGLRIAVIPDTQVKPGVPIDHLEWCGKYLAEQQPDVIIQIGDFSDMESLSMHDGPGSLALEGRRYHRDIEAAHIGMEKLVTPITKGESARWRPKKVLFYGNHEERIIRAIKREPKMQGFMSLDDLRYAEYGWTLFEFLQPITINGVAFCHYFPSGIMGRPITTAKALLTKLHMSAFAGHQQGRDIAYSKRADGKDLTAIISGSFYQHSEDYLSPFTNQHWRGMYILHEVKDGSFDEMAVSIDYLRRKFSKRSIRRAA